MSYSTHDDLKQLHEDIDELTSQIVNLSFSGSGPNDLIPEITPERNIVVTTAIVKYHIQIKSLGISVDKFSWSDVGDALGWVGEDVMITGDTQYLNYGTGIRFKRSFNHNLNDYWRFDLNPPDSSDERTMANNWVDDRLKQYISTPVSSPTQTIILAEANYAIYLILRANKRELIEDFRNEAGRLIDEMLEIPVRTPPPEATTELPVT